MIWTFRFKSSHAIFILLTLSMCLGAIIVTISLYLFLSCMCVCKQKTSSPLCVLAASQNLFFNKNFSFKFLIPPASILLISFIFPLK